MTFKNRVKKIWEFTFEVFDNFVEDKAPKFGAALSFYTIFSLAPILIIAVNMAGFIFGQEAARGEIYSQIRGLIGDEGALAVQTALKNSQYSWSGMISIIISFVTIIISSTVVFIDIQESLNLIWKIKPKPGNSIIRGLLRERLKSFTIVLVAGFLLLVSLIISALIGAFSNFLGDSFFAIPPLGLEIINNVITFVIIFILFMMIFKFLPDAHLRWEHVWVGALVTAILFIIGKFLISFYIGTSALGSSYGAYGSLIILLLWIYYSAQILYLGAEFTQVYANKYGRGIIPKSRFKKFANMDVPIEITEPEKDDPFKRDPAEHKDSET